MNCSAMNDHDGSSENTSSSNSESSLLSSLYVLDDLSTLNLNERIELYKRLGDNFFPQLREAISDYGKEFIYAVYPQYLLALASAYTEVYAAASAHSSEAYSIGYLDDSYLKSLRNSCISYFAAHAVIVSQQMCDAFYVKYRNKDTKSDIDRFLALTISSDSKVKPLELAHEALDFIDYPNRNSLDINKYRELYHIMLRPELCNNRKDLFKECESCYPAVVTMNIVCCYFLKIYSIFYIVIKKTADDFLKAHRKGDQLEMYWINNEVELCEEAFLDCGIPVDEGVLPAFNTFTDRLAQSKKPVPFFAAAVHGALSQRLGTDHLIK